MGSSGIGEKLKFVPSNFSFHSIEGKILSGAAGLVYQVIWVRRIDKIIGGAPFAVAMVLSVFMAGLVRYRKFVNGYCRRVLVPSYGIFNCQELKAACADIQAAAIQ